MPSGPLKTRPRSILLVLLSALGDTTLALPVVSALRRSFPSANLTWVLQPGPHSLVGTHRAVDEFILFERGERGRTPRSVAAGVRSLRKTARKLRDAAQRQPGESFDLLLDLQVYLKAGLLTALTPARIKLGFDGLRCRDLNRFFTSHQIPPHPAKYAHIQDQYFEFLKHIGVDPEPVDYGLELTGQEEEEQKVFFSSLGRPACALVVGSSDPRKNWNPEGYAALATILRSEFGLRPILVGGRTKEEEAMARAISTLLGCASPGDGTPGRDGGVLDARGGGIRRLLWLLAGSRLVVSPDTGPAHMARAMQVPVVSLFGFTNPKRSGPRGPGAELVVDGYARVPGEAYGVTVERRRGGMERITPAMVKEKVELALGSGGA